MVTNPAQLSATNEQLPRARSKRNSQAIKRPFFSIFLLAWTKRWSAAGPRPRDFDFNNLKMFGMNGCGAVRLPHPHPNLPPSRGKEHDTGIINKSLVMLGFRRIQNEIPSIQRPYQFRSPLIRQYEKRSFSSGAFNDDPVCSGHVPSIKCRADQPCPTISDQLVAIRHPEQTKLPSSQKAIFCHLFVGLDKKMVGGGAETPRL